MPSPYQLARQYRAALLARDIAAMARLVQAYQLVATTLKRELDALFREMEQARNRGEDINRRWMQKQQRLQSLLTQVQVEMERYGRGTLAPEVSRGQRYAVNDAQVQARAMVEAQEASLRFSWDAVPTDAVESLVGYMGSGTPIGDYFAGVASQYTSVAPAGAPSNLHQILVSGVAQGKGVRQIAREANRAIGIGLDRALTIARTETLRSYRSASQASFAANSHVVLKWRWLAALSGRTCPVCLAMHGTLHEVTEEFGSHINCRCAMVPVTDTYIDEPFEFGEDWLRRQPEELQAEVFQYQAKEAVVMWRKRHVSLADFVHKYDDPVWGTVRTACSLEEALLK